MLAIFLAWALRIGWLRRGASLAVTMLITVSYVLLIDADPPAVRAALAVVLAACASLISRRTLDANLLAAAALLVIAQNPADLFRTGPQLSFLAAGVLAWAAARRADREDRENTEQFAAPSSAGAAWARRWLANVGQGLLVSTAIFVAATPLVAHRFHIVSPIALLLTPLLAFPVAAALLCGFLTLLLGTVVPPLAAPLGATCGTFLALIQQIVEWADRITLGRRWLPGPGDWQTALFYAALALCFLWPARSRGRRAIATAAIVWGAVTLVPQHTLPPGVELRATFISVGHGLSVLVEERDGPTWLYDCGRFGAAERGAQQIAGVLWSRGITHLDGVVISHTDADHYNALPFLIEQFSLGAVYASPLTCDDPSAGAEQIRQAAAAAGVRLTPLAVGDVFPFATPAATVEILHPPPVGVAGNDNANSVVLLVESRGRRPLLTGDLEGVGLERLLARPAVRCDVLLAPHHGSVRSNPAGTVGVEQHNDHWYFFNRREPSSIRS
jgi:competence protein ComEC